jgi:hypothetical protein
VFPLYKGSRAVVYSPFSTPEDSSPRFVALAFYLPVRAWFRHVELLLPRAGR